MKQIFLEDIDHIKDYVKNKDKVVDSFFLHLDILLVIAKKRKDAIILLALENDNSILACGLFSKNRRRVFGSKYNSLYLYGYSFFDYNHFYCESEYEQRYLSFIRDFCKFKSLDLFIIENVRKIINISNSIIIKDYTRVFNSHISENRFSYISNKKSLKRHRNKLKNNFKYDVFHFLGSEIKNQYLNDLIKLHKERWSFDNINSSFKEIGRKYFYSTDLDNRILTIIYVNDEIFALHYGMIYDDNLIWHTPVLNIKYLTYSPIEVLLYETAMFCNHNAINVLDFGLGTEKYKDRFSNQDISLYQYFISINQLSYFRLFFFHRIKKLSLYSNIKQYLYKFYNNIRIIGNSIIFYRIFSDKFIFPVKDTRLSLIKISRYIDFVDFFRERKIKVKRYHYKRFINHDVYYSLIKDDNIICSGWAKKHSIYISEINKKIKFSQGLVLYDYNTPIKYRGKGYYTEILRRIISSYQQVLYIYSLKNNTSSIHAISTAGFHKIKARDII